MSEASGDYGGAAEAFFLPTDEAKKELIDKFLRPKIAGEPLPLASRFIHDADVCAVAPGELAATYEPAPGGGRPVWYFFSPVHLKMRQKPFCRRRFCFKELALPKEKRGLLPEWSMVEYGITEDEEEAGQQQFVLCQVFRRFHT